MCLNILKSFQINWLTNLRCSRKRRISRLRHKCEFTQPNQTFRLMVDDEPTIYIKLLDDGFDKRVIDLLL